MDFNPIASIAGGLTQAAQGLFSGESNSLLSSLPGISSSGSVAQSTSTQSLLPLAGSSSETVLQNAVSENSINQLVSNIASMLMENLVKPLLSLFAGQSSENGTSVLQTGDNTAASTQTTASADAAQDSGDGGVFGWLSQNGGQIMSTITGLFSAFGGFFALL